MLNQFKYILLILLMAFIVSCNNKTEKKHEHKHVHNSDSSKKAECCTTDENKVNIKNEESSNNNSLYDIDLEFTNMNNESIKIEGFKGKYLITSMIFTQCEFACPTIVNNVKDIQEYIGSKADMNYVMVSFDYKRDKPSKLKEFYNKEKLNKSWHLLTGTSSNIRIYSMIFNINYQELDNGDFSHSNAIFLVNKEGKIVEKFEGLKINTKDIANKILKLINTNF